MLRTLVGLLALITLMPAHAALFAVDDTGTANDLILGDGVCATFAGVCTLQAAIGETNALAGPDTVIVPAGTYPGAFARVQGELEIVGAGIGQTIFDGGGTLRLLDVGLGGPVTISGITFQNGAASAGGAISSFGTVYVHDAAFTGNSSGSVGGAIENTAGTLTVERCTFTGNDASAGGAIFGDDSATTTVRDSTFTGNTGGSGAAVLHNQGGATFLVVNSTITNNGGGPSGGYAFVNAANAGLATFIHVTIADNADGGITINTGSSAIVANTIIAGNSAAMLRDDCGGSTNVTSMGGNLSGDASCGFGSGTDLENSDPMLAALADNGGATETRALQGGSPALDSAVLAQCESTDQRGVTRPQGSDCDRGAFESGGTVPTTTSTTFPSTSTSATSSSTSTSTSSTSTTFPSCQQGECNGDDTLTTADVTCIILRLFDQISQASACEDCNQDELLTTADVTCATLCVFDLCPGG